MSHCSSPASNYGDGRGCQDVNCPRHGGEPEAIYDPPVQRWEATLSDEGGDLG